MTFVEFVEYFRLWGPLGIMAALGVWGCIHLYRNGRADAAKHRSECDAMAKEYAKTIEDQARDYVTRMTEQQKVHREQTAELTDRFVSLHTAAVTENRELTAQVRSLIEVVSRKRGR